MWQLGLSQEPLVWVRKALLLVLKLWQEPPQVLALEPLPWSLGPSPQEQAWQPQELLVHPQAWRLCRQPWQVLMESQLVLALLLPESSLLVPVWLEPQEVVAVHQRL